ncbi:DELTA-actitoxin-Aeq1b-like [Huso huso]|uniref:DELTA-actitoxin-Aeq1b-like n=1 Tax=Huso huso TaxID=61971 RepID=A0ABR0Y5U2_HUSHU
MCVGIEISNNSKFTLDSPEFYVHGGIVLSPPTLIIEPGKSGTCMFTKYAYSWCGVEGVLAYDFNGKKLCLMFSNPFWSWVHNRKFNLMIYDEKKNVNQQLFNNMGLENRTINSNICVVGDSSLSKITVDSEDVKVTATMSSSVKSVIKIDIRDRFVSA